MISGDRAQWVKALILSSDSKVAGSMPVLGITLLDPWKRHLALIS